MKFEEWWNEKALRYFAIIRENGSMSAERVVDLEQSCKSLACIAWQAAQPKWQPIETIPLGVKVLVYGKDYGVSQAVIYFYPETSEFNGLTHWQPLPTPPQEQ